MGTYTLNQETQKIELHFDREEYMTMSDMQKSEIKRAFLFSRSRGAWVSRAKYPATHSAEAIARKLGLHNDGISGDHADFAHSMDQKHERALQKAERYEERAERKEREGEQKTAAFEHLRGDIAFMTQPNINSSGGRAFARQRERIFEAYDKGLEAYRQSEWYAKRAEEIRKEAGTVPDTGFCDRRIREAQKAVRDLRSNLAHYDDMLERIKNGETVKRISGDEITAEEVAEWIERTEIRAQYEMSREAYYTEILEQQGGMKFSKENISAGDCIEIFGRSGVYTVVKANKATVTVESFGFTLKFRYAEIKDKVEA